MVHFAQPFRGGVRRHRDEAIIRKPYQTLTRGMVAGIVVGLGRQVDAVSLPPGRG